ncbi:MAG: dual specificity protein phosphatase family protein [Waddliaceae bacterium]
MSVLCLKVLEYQPEEKFESEEREGENVETSNVIVRLFHSRVFWTGAAGIGSAFVCLPALGAIGVYSLYDRKRIFSEASQYYNVAMYQFGMKMHQDWGNQVYAHPNGAQLWVGAVPAANFGHDKVLIERGVSSILSVMNEYELSDTMAICPVKGESWVKKGLQHMLIESDDMKGLGQKEFDHALRFIRFSLEAGRSLYVHCKAGKGRSVSVVLAYLVLYAREGSLTHCIDHLKAIRPQINFNSGQQAAMEEYIENFKQERVEEIEIEPLLTK